MQAAFLPARVVSEYSRLVVFRLGRITAVKGPGVVAVIPLVDRVMKVDLREFFLEIPRQTAITKDNAPISIDFITFFKVVDVQASVVQVADFSGAAHLAIAILAALFHRSRTGEGQELNVSLLDATMFMLANYSVAVLDGDAELEPMGSGHPQLVPFQAFPTADGYLVIATGTNKLFREFCAVISRSDLAEDARFATNQERVRHRDELEEILTLVMRARPTSTWVELLEQHEIPCAPVNKLTEAFRDPQLAANEMVLEIAHPSLGTLHQIGIPYKLELTPCFLHRHPPLLGEHTDEVLTEILHLPAPEIERLRGAGTI